MRHPAVIAIDRRFHPDHVGTIPTFLDLDDPRPAAEQFEERYVFGGWCAQRGFTNNGMILQYPEDPPLHPIAVMMLRDEMICIYPYAYVAIFQPDGSFEACRMD